MISGTIVGPALARGGTAFTSAEHGVWWMVLGLGLGILVLGLFSTGRWALDTAARAAALFEEVDILCISGNSSTLPSSVLLSESPVIGPKLEDST